MFQSNTLFSARHSSNQLLRRWGGAFAPDVMSNWTLNLPPSGAEH